MHAGEQPERDGYGVNRLRLNPHQLVVRFAHPRAHGEMTHDAAFSCLWLRVGTSCQGEGNRVVTVHCLAAKHPYVVNAVDVVKDATGFALILFPLAALVSRS